jgi:diaminohydroxyphosphoribosylaminopyrimidine deaminase/5-amino-6-(5-phosphoribosylamino)uracil reductase
MSLERAIELAATVPGRAYPKPTVGAVVVAGGEIVGEGVTEAGGRHGEVVALEAAGARARGGTLYVTMEPCAHWGTTPPCTEAAIAACVARVVAGSRDPNPEAAGGLERLRDAGVEAELDDRFEARAQNEAWRTWVSRGRPFVTYKVAVSLDGRVTVPGRRWVTGEESRRMVHELRAASDAVAVGMGTVRVDAPRLDAREVPTPRGQPRRLAFGRGPLPEGSELELRPGRLEDELAALAREGVQSLLLEGGPTLAKAFLEADLVDKLCVFVAPVVAGGDGPVFLPRLGSSRPLSHLSAQGVGEDVLLRAYVHEP